MTLNFCCSSLNHIFNQKIQLGRLVPAHDCQVGIKTWPETSKRWNWLIPDLSRVHKERGKSSHLYTVLVLVSPVPTREAFLSDTQKKEEENKKERENKAPVEQGCGEGKRVVLLKSKAGKLKEP